jgi:hypothetical protein
MFVYQAVLVRAIISNQQNIQAKNFVRGHKNTLMR